MAVARRYVAPASIVLVASLVVAACGNPSTTTKETSSSSSSSSSSATVPQINAAAFTSDFSPMKQLTDIAAKGKGKIGVLLPDTTTSTRYVQYDAPYLTKAFETAGLTSDQFTIQNAHGSASTMQTQADAMITGGATVLLVDPLDPGSGAAIEAKAQAAGAQVIDYDRLVTGGPSNRYYVSFNNVKVGELIGKGEVDCISKWNVAKPNILIMNGDPTDNNAKLFAQGYHSVLDPKFSDGTYVKVAEPAGTWTPSVAATTFQQQWTAHKNINAVVTPNDDNANAVIAVLKSNKVPAKKFPTTGQDASLPGLQNILTGYQCGTVYKPIYLEAQAAASLALFLRAGIQPPLTLVNAKTQDTKINKAIGSVYTVPIWVTTENMNNTVVKDGAVTKDKLCAGDVASACKAAGIG